MDDFEVTIVARFETRADAEAARSDMEEVVGKNNGELEENSIVDDEPDTSEHDRRADGEENGPTEPGDDERRLRRIAAQEAFHAASSRHSRPGG